MNRVLYSHEHVFQHGKILTTFFFSLVFTLTAIHHNYFQQTTTFSSGFTPVSPVLMAGSAPSIAAALHIAGVDYATSGTSGNFDLVAEIVVKNTGTTNLTNLGLTTNLGSPAWLGGSFVGLVYSPVLILNGTHGNTTTATTPPGTNASFNGNGNLLTGGGVLEPGQTYIVRFRIEVNPDAPGTPAIPKMQLTARGDAPDGGGGTVTVTDESDSGYNPETTNAGWPGSAAGFNDPTLLTDCWQSVSNGITCNKLVQVSVNASCTVNLLPDAVLEGEFQQCTGDILFPLGGYYRITEVKTLNGITSLTDLDAKTVNIFEISGAYVGQTLWVKVMDVVGKNACSGQIQPEDKLPPVFECPPAPYQLLCNENPNDVPAPTALDNCDSKPLVIQTSNLIMDNNYCDDGTYRIRRVYKTIDQYGNQSDDLCIVDIQITRPPVHFPKDVNWLCDQYNGFPNIVKPTSLDPGVTDADLSDDDLDVSATLSVQILGKTGSGIVNVAGEQCSYQVNYNDQPLKTCGNSFKIMRSWTVLDWCSGMLITTGANGEDNLQMIHVMDVMPPTITLAPYEVKVDVPAQYPKPCRSQGLLLPPAVSDNCNTVSVKIMTPVGEAVYLPGGGNQGGFIPAPGLPVGTHPVTYVATDACGNETSIVVQVTVKDNTTPAAVCNGVTAVSLTTNGLATVFAQTFNAGTTDNCCIDHFEVRRMTDACNDGHDDTVFGPSVVFCCNDLTANPVTVVFRAFDCYGNFNDCMVNVAVSDKMIPIVQTCPPHQRISCDFYAESLEEELNELAGNPVAQNQLLDPLYGTATFFDNCSITIQKTLTRSLDQCGEGVITRTWKATDTGGNTSNTCTQNIFVDHVSDWVVEFPADTTFNCGNMAPAFGEPEIFFKTCEMIATSYQDEVFTVVPDACYKVVRTWEIINWCAVGNKVNQEVTEVPEDQLGLPYPACDLDGDGDCDSHTYRDSWNKNYQSKADMANQTTVPDTDPDSDPWDGFISHQQIIKVIDLVAPVFTNGCSIPDVCVAETSCEATVVLPKPAIQDCNTQVTLTATSSLGNGLGPFTNVSAGIYTITYKASDNCNNSATCTTTLKVVDCKEPTVVCDDLVTDIMLGVPPMVPVPARLFDEGSTDNCTDKLHFSFSPDIADSVKIYDCSQLGKDTVEVWVTDDAGNQDFCETVVTIQDNFDRCGDPLVVSVGGQIDNENGLHIGNVTVNMNGLTSGTMTTTNSGSYQFTNVLQGSDVSVTPKRDDNHLNGVTTFDMVLISKHILGIAPLDSPYKRIAADVNNSKNITTFDLVEIRKLVLLVNEKIPNNTSWRFVDKKYVFPNPVDPWSAPFPEIININNIPADVLDADFVAIKVGDVNSSASFSNEQAGDRSTAGSLVFETKTSHLQAGQVFHVDLTLRDLEVSGFQFTLNFDPQQLDFQEIIPSLTTAGNFGLTLLDEGAITVSWNDEVENWPQNKPVIRLSFIAKTNMRLEDVLYLDSRFTPAEAYSPDGDMLDVRLQFTGNEQITGFELFQNKPNPFHEKTAIGFRLPQAGSATLVVTDISGRLIQKTEAEFPPGYNEISLDRQEFPASGVFHYRLDTPYGSATKRMVLLK
jgi:hypothetical protein